MIPVSKKGLLEGKGKKKRGGGGGGGRVEVILHTVTYL